MSKNHFTEMDPEGSCKKDNSKPKCNCFGTLSENEILFFEAKCQCNNNGTKMDSQNDLSRQYFKIRKQLWHLTHLELRLLKIDIEDHLQKWEASQ